MATFSRFVLLLARLGCAPRRISVVVVVVCYRLWRVVACAGTRKTADFASIFFSSLLCSNLTLSGLPDYRSRGGGVAGFRASATLESVRVVFIGIVVV